MLGNIVRKVLIEIDELGLETRERELRLYRKIKILFTRKNSLTHPCKKIIVQLIKNLLSVLRSPNISFSSRRCRSRLYITGSGKICKSSQRKIQSRL
jgi:hypothetical protein